MLLGPSSEKITPERKDDIKSRIARTKAILDLAISAADIGSIGIMLMTGGPNGVISAACANILEMPFRTLGEDPQQKSCIVAATKAPATYDLRFMLAAPDIAGLAAGSVIVIQIDDAEEGAQFVRSLTSPGLPFLVATCHS